MILPADEPSAVNHPTVREKLDLAIAVLTFRRPIDLAAILPQLAEQARRIDRNRYIPRLVVVDNDPEGGAADAVWAFGASLDDLSVRYENEILPGISAARNRALDSASDCELLVFIDDDERPSPNWLPLLLGTYERFGSAAVVGPVISEYEVEPDSWIQAGGFFRRRRLATGTTVEVAATNNLLLDLRLVREHGLSFDNDFGLTGGDDTMFTRQLRKTGGSILWCDEAIVFDIVPRQRITRRWVVLRALSSGNSWSLTSLKLCTTALERFGWRLRLTGQGAVRVVGGCGRIVLGLVGRNETHRARGTRTAARGLGMLLGAWGSAYTEYRR